MMSMQSIILAGGKGTRLKPYTTVFPKPLMPIGDFPILEIVIRQLKYFGFTRTVLAVGHLKELIQAYFTDGSKWNLKIDYSAEETPLGTAAPLKLIHNLDDYFLVMNGDVLTNLDFRKFFQFHVEGNAMCTIATYQKPVKIDLGVLKIHQDRPVYEQEIYEYIEKPTLNYRVSMGVYAFKKDVLNFIPTSEYLDFPDLIKILLRNSEKILGYPFEGYWLDIGRSVDYERATEEFEKNKSEFLR